MITYKHWLDIWVGTLPAYAEPTSACLRRIVVGVMIQIYFLIWPWLNWRKLKTISSVLMTLKCFRLLFIYCFTWLYMYLRCPLLVLLINMEGGRGVMDITQAQLVLLSVTLGHTHSLEFNSKNTKKQNMSSGVDAGSRRAAWVANHPYPSLPFTLPTPFHYHFYFPILQSPSVILPTFLLFTPSSRKNVLNSTL